MQITPETIDRRGRQILQIFAKTRRISAACAAPVVNEKRRGLCRPRRRKIAVRVNRFQ
jgi:hypothetical protein